MTVRIERTQCFNTLNFTTRETLNYCAHSKRSTAHELVALRVARELRQAGVSTQALRRIVEFLRRTRGLGDPLAESPTS